MEDSQGADGRNETSLPEPGAEEENKDLSPEELLIKQNWDVIQQLKAEYSEADTKVIESESGSVELYIYETGGYVYQDLTKRERIDTLLGTYVPFADVIIMDYASDTVICPLTSGENEAVRYSPGNQKKFYCVVFCDDYDIRVTYPYQVVGGEGHGWDYIFLEKSGGQYTSLSQLRLYARSLDSGEGYSIVPSDYNVNFTLRNIANDQSGGTSYNSFVTEAGILGWGRGSYFSLNTDYVVDLYIECVSGEDRIKSNHRTFDGLVTNSNQVDLYFDFDQEDNGA